MPSKIHGGARAQFAVRPYPIAIRIIHLPRLNFLANLGTRSCKPVQCLVA